MLHTRPSHRGQGHAGTAVAALTALLVEQGRHGLHPAIAGGAARGVQAPPEAMAAAAAAVYTPFSFIVESNGASLKV